MIELTLAFVIGCAAGVLWHAWFVRQAAGLEKKAEAEVKDLASKV